MTRAVRFLVAWGTPVGLGVLLAHASCSPSSVDVDGLIAPPVVSVVTLDPSVAGTSVRAQATPNFPATSEYFTDRLDVHVFDGSLDALRIVNDLLCLLGQARYDALLNRGLYLAQIDESLCEPKGGGVNQPGAGRELESWLLRSERGAPDAPHHVAFWVPQMDGPGGASAPVATLFSSLDLFAPPTATNPYGIFRMNFAGASAGQTVADPDYCGLITAKSPASGHLGFELFLLVGDPNLLPAVGREATRAQVNVDLAADQQSGVAHVSKTFRRNDPQTGDSGLLTEDHRLAFAGATLVRSRDGGATRALDRTTFTARNLRYNLYDNGAQQGGQRVRLAAGAPILLASGVHAYVDERGLHLPAGATAADGDPVLLEANGVVDPNPLTLRLAPGRLIENRRNVTPLPQIVNEPFEWDVPYDPLNPGTVRYRLTYDGNGFLALEQFDFPTATWLPITPFYVAVASYGVLRMRSARFGGNVAYVDGANDLAWYTERVVNGDASLFGGGRAPLALYGYVGCMRSGLTALEVEGGDVSFPDQLDPLQPYAYSFQPSDLTLYHDDQQGNLKVAGLAAGEVPKSGPFVDGMRSGPLVPSTAGLQTVFDLWSAPLYYTWESGANPWNQWAGLEDPGKLTLLAFDPPLQFVYVHSAANDQNGDPSQDGKQFLLEYRGDGQLYGIPYVAIDTDGDGQPDHDVPLINLADGVPLGPTGVEYVVRTTERELTLAPASVIPPGLDPSLADALTLPDGSAYVTPAIGALPAIAAPPTVIAGEIQAAARR